MARGARDLDGRGLPVACGAIGEFDPSTVTRVAAALRPGLLEAHRDSRSVLLVDREPIRWYGDGELGPKLERAVTERRLGPVLRKS